MKKRTTLQGFLIRHFIIILLLVGGAESGITFFVNRFFLPVLQKQLYANFYGDKGLTQNEIVFLVLVVILQLLLRAIRAVLPASVKNIVTVASEQLDDLTLQALPSLSESLTLSEIEKGQALGLFLCMISLVCLILLPYVLGAIVFARITIREIGKLQRQRELAREEYDKQRNLLLSDIAHDLRTPMTTVAGYAKALSDGMVTDAEKQQEYLHTIMNKTIRMNELIQLLFEYVKLDSKGFELDKESFDLCELLRECAASVYQEIEEREMEFFIEIPEEIYTVYADKMQLSRVMINLLNNAVKHNLEGTGILLLVKPLSGMLLVVVADNGTEISAETQKHLFEPFYKGDKSRTSGSGSGLGLSIAQKIIQMHGWEIELRQPYQEYTKAFLIKIPCGMERDLL